MHSESIGQLDVEKCYQLNGYYLQKMSVDGKSMIIGLEWQVIKKWFGLCYTYWMNWLPL